MNIFRLTRFLVLCVCFVDRCLSFCAFSFGHCVNSSTRLAAASDKVYQLLAHGRWFSPGTPASSTTKTDRHDIAEILLKMALNTKINQSIVNFSSNLWDAYLLISEHFVLIYINVYNYICIFFLETPTLSCSIAL